MTVRLRATVTVEYDADPSFYGTTDPHVMAQIDQDQWSKPRDDMGLDGLEHFAAAHEIGDDDVTVRVVPV